MAGSTFIFQNNVQLFLTAEHCFFECYVHSGAEIGSPHGAVVCPSSAASEQIAENITENVAHIRAVEVKAAEAARSASAVLKGGVAELVVLSSLIRIAEHGIGFGCLFKLCLSIFITRIYIRVIFLG